MGIVIKKTIANSIINYIGVLLGVINILWLQTAIITELQIGILSYITDVTILLLPFILFGTSGLPARFIHLFTDGKEKNSFLTLLFIVPLVTIVLLFIIFLIFKNNIISVLGKDAINYSKYLIFIFPLLFCYAYQYMLETILATQSHVVFSSFLKNIYRRLVLILLLLIYSIQLIDFYNLLLIYITAHFFEVLMLFIFFRKKLRFLLTKPTVLFTHSNKKEIYSYTLFLIIGVSGVVMVGKVDTVMISSMTNDFKLLGVYAIAFFIATIIELPKRIVHQLVFPIMSRLNTEKNEAELANMYRQTGINMTIIGVFIFFIVWYNIDQLFLIIPNGIKYSAGKWVVFFIGLSKVVDNTLGTTDLAINATKHYKLNGILVPILIISTIGTNYYLIPIYGITGAALATAITVFLYSVTKYVIVLRLIKLNLFSKEYIFILFTSLLIVLTFFLKSRWLTNNYLEIMLNSIVITVIFIGGNFILKSSKEMNHLLISTLKRFTSKP